MEKRVIRNQYYEEIRDTIIEFFEEICDGIEDGWSTVIDKF